MKIAIICSYYPWPPSRGGVETVVRQVSTELSQIGNEVHVVTSALNTTTKEKVSEVGTDEVEGVIVHKLNSGLFRISHAQILTHLKDTIDEINPDIVHAHNIHPHLFQLACWRDNYKYKLISEPHYPVANIESYVAKAVLPITLRALAIASKKIDLFIAHAEIERTWLIQNNINSDKIRTILFPFAQTPLFDMVQKEDSEKDGDLVFVGRVVPIKGLHILIKALSIVNETQREVKLTIIGPCNEKYLEYLNCLIKKENLTNKVKILGAVSDEKKYQVMLAHKIFVLPSLGDFTPGVIMESQALGIPVIATRVGAVPELMVDKETGLLVKAGDSFELAKAITTLMSDSTLRKNMAFKGKTYSKKFLADVTINKLMDNYNALLM